tara:strand:+ start:3866 stop:5005 length:1140 start_codon:yes stop_codon:yes gene_type:complete
MAKGDISPSESYQSHDPETGVQIRQITSQHSIHHHPFYYVPAYDDEMRWLFFISYRSGAPQIFAERRNNGDLIQLTNRSDINEWSLHPAHDSNSVYFTTKTGGWRLDMESLREEQIVCFGSAEKASGMVGAGMGTTTLSSDDQWWAIPVQLKARGQLLVVNTSTGDANAICENTSIGHPEFHPNDTSLLRYGGSYDQRIWVVNRNGSNHQLVYNRNISRKEWIVHECWRPHTRDILTTNWPHGVMAIDIDSKKTRWVSCFNAWHPMVDRTGTYMIADTKNPDIGLQLFDIKEELTIPRPVCRSRSSNIGEHWDTGHCPYDDGPVNVYAPQHTHPHPNISPDGKYVVFTSDYSGVSQIYEALLETFADSRLNDKHRVTVR